MANHSSSHYPDIGVLGEDLVAKWLQSTGWIIIHRRFSCRWGEIDIIAQQDDLLGFIEVKTRTAGSWDGGGRYAVAPRKQAKIWRAAEMFLVQYPDKADYSCRFDVAIVYCQPLSSQQMGAIANKHNLFCFATGEYQLILQEYIPAAFDDSTVGG
ncbi:MAG: YraN family protein [Calothrix sp. MO_192.B10]|nr:YraN family protein [Calothrix sp. MO_192.B10]